MVIIKKSQKLTISTLTLADKSFHMWRFHSRPTLQPRHMRQCGYCQVHDRTRRNASWCKCAIHPTRVAARAPQRTTTPSCHVRPPRVRGGAPPQRSPPPT